MAWKFNNAVIRVGRAWTGKDGIQHPGNWMTCWSDTEKKAAGLVWEDDPAPFDSRFYWDAKTPRSLTDTKDEDGNVVEGLKSLYKTRTKSVAKSLLESTDWQIIKAAEVSSYSVPNSILSYRAAIRTASNKIEASIDGASDIKAFIVLFDTLENGKSAMDDWPDEWRY